MWCPFNTRQWWCSIPFSTYNPMNEKSNYKFSFEITGEGENPTVKATFEGDVKAFASAIGAIESHIRKVRREGE